MPAGCNLEPMLFACLDRRDMVAVSDGGAITSDVGALLLGVTDRALNLAERFAGCFSDGRAAERMSGRGENGANSWFVVAVLRAKDLDARTLCERVYCARDDMENRIKSVPPRRRGECQLDLFVDRTCAATMTANQLRLWFASMADVLLAALRRIALRLAKAPAARCV